MRHLDVASLRCTNHRKLVCCNKITFWILKRAFFIFFSFTFTANPWLLEEGQEQLHVEFYCLCCDLVKRFRSKHMRIYLKNIHTMQHDGARKSQRLCKALNKRAVVSRCRLFFDFACIVQQLTWTLGECVTLLYKGSYACRAEKNKNWDKIKCQNDKFVNELWKTVTVCDFV